MAIVYFDSSAFVKLLIDEDGTDLAVALWDGGDAAVSSRLAYPEVRAALAAAGRARRLGRVAQRQAETIWETVWAQTQRVELTEAIGAHAGALAGTHGLRGADAVHLASVLAVHTDNTIFAVWDNRMRAGARSAGVHVAPVTINSPDVPPADR